MHRLKNLIKSLDGKGYKEYKKLRGSYRFADFVLHIDHVQGDPFAAPSRIRIEIEKNTAKYPSIFLKTEAGKIATEDFILRKLYKYISKLSDKVGSGKSGLLSIQKPSSVILKQSAVVFREKSLEIRFFAGLPAFGRRINATGAEKIFFEKIPQIVYKAVIFNKYDLEKLKVHVQLKEHQTFIRKKLKELKLVCFIKDGAILPRETGISDKPLKDAIPFKSPDNLRISIHLPDGTYITGMGIREGVTLITGGGYHGKSTLLRAIIEGIYDHVPDDGREYVVTIKEAHYIRAEDRRRVEKVNIKPFIDNLPKDIDTALFSTDNASGSTSQATNIQESVELGARLLLLDEDTSATNFMTRDRRMQELVEKKKEPITPFLDRVRELYEKHGISTILVAGGIGDYLDVADTVIQMDTFLPQDVTERARAIVKNFPSHRKNETAETPYTFTSRIPDPQSIHPEKGKRDFKIDAPRRGIVVIGREEIDLTLLEEILTREQTRSIGYAILYLLRNGFIDGKTPFKTLAKIIDEIHPDRLSPFSYPMGELCEVRGDEVIKALNRLRTIRVFPEL